MKYTKKAKKYLKISWHIPFGILLYNYKISQMGYKKGGVRMINLKRLKGLRVENDLSQEDMAKLIGISSSSYQRKESGENQFLLIEADKIAKVLKKDIRDIFFTS